MAVVAGVGVARDRAGGEAGDSLILITLNHNNNKSSPDLLNLTGYEPSARISRLRYLK
jgi:hypothetical protein